MLYSQAQRAAQEERFRQQQFNKEKEEFIKKLKAGEAFLKNASQRLKADKQVVLAAVAQEGDVLK